MKVDEFLGSSALLGGYRVAVDAFADAFESRMRACYATHDLMDVVDRERLERLHIWEHESSLWLLVEQAGSPLKRMAAAERCGDAQKLQYAKHVMQHYYERILDGEAARREVLEKCSASSKSTMAALLGDE